MSNAAATFLYYNLKACAIQRVEATLRRPAVIVPIAFVSASGHDFPEWQSCNCCPIRVGND
jgi:hypothetical protein